MSKYRYSLLGTYQGSTKTDKKIGEVRNFYESDSIDDISGYLADIRHFYPLHKFKIVEND